MANAIYPKFKTNLLKQTGANYELDSAEGTTGVYVALVDTGTYTYSAAHEFYSDLSGIGAEDELTTKTVGTVAEGVFDSDNATFTAVAGTVTYEALVLYRKNAGANTTWPLIAYIDTNVTNLPVTSNGGDITVTWNASGIFQL